MTAAKLALLAAFGLIALATTPGQAAETKSGPTKTEDQAAGNFKAAYKEDGKYFTADDVPTYNVAEDGTVDWPTYSGFRRYHSECHVCHGPEGEGSSYAPALKKSAVDMDYYSFVDVVINGRTVVTASTNSVMPSFGTNRNVTCYLDDIYVYLKARGTEALGRGRPRKREEKHQVIRETENDCLDG